MMTPTMSGSHSPPVSTESQPNVTTTKSSSEEAEEEKSQDESTRALLRTTLSAEQLTNLGKVTGRGWRARRRRHSPPIEEEEGGNNNTSPDVVSSTNVCDSVDGHAGAEDCGPSSFLTDDGRPLERTAEISGEYQAYLREASVAKFEDLKMASILSIDGVDAFNRPVVVFAPASLPSSFFAGPRCRENLHRMMLYTLSEMDAVVSKGPYVFVYAHTNIQWFNRRLFSWFLRVYKVMPRPFKKNLKGVYVVHPTSGVKALFFFFRPFVSKKFWKKLRYFDSVRALCEYLSPCAKEIVFPPYVLSKDAEIRRAIQRKRREREAWEKDTSLYKWIPFLNYRSTRSTARSRNNSDDYGAGTPGASNLTSSSAAATWQGRESGTHLSDEMEARRRSRRRKRVFGVDLETLAARNPGDDVVPAILRRLARFIEKNGVRVEGLFRVSCAHDLLVRGVNQIDAGEFPAQLFCGDESFNVAEDLDSEEHLVRKSSTPSAKRSDEEIPALNESDSVSAKRSLSCEHVDLHRKAIASSRVHEDKKSNEEEQAVHLAAGLYKQFFRDLPVPLITFYAHPEVIRLASEIDVCSPKMENRRVIAAKLSKIFKSMPDAHNKCLDHFLKFVDVLLSNSNSTRMTEHNLSIVFTPNILRPRKDAGPVAHLQSLKSSVKVVTFMFEYRYLL